MSNKTVGWIVISFLVFMIVGGALHYWGVTTYLVGLRGAIGAQSPHNKKSEDILLDYPDPKGQVLLLHGLNFDAEGMRDIGKIFYELGYRVLIPRLVAHRGDVNETFHPQRENWNAQVNEWGRKLGGSRIICAGYSLGALLLTERYLNGEIECSHFILFAPAYVPHVPDLVIKIARRVLPRTLQVPSAIPKDYRHQDVIGLISSLSLFDVLESFRTLLYARQADAPKMPPGLVFLDMRDEVVDSRPVENLIREKFPNWQVKQVNVVKMDTKHAFHLIVDEAHLGPEQWQTVRDDVTRLLQAP